MKVIELLNRIANGEEIPKKILYKKKTYLFDGEILNYVNEHSEYDFLLEEDITAMLNDEVEIIEEDKKIEMLIIGKDDVAWCEGNMKTDEEMVDIVLDIKDKINEIIMVINEMREDK